MIFEGLKVCVKYWTKAIIFILCTFYEFSFRFFFAYGSVVKDLQRTVRDILRVGLGTLVDVSPNFWPFVEVSFSQKWVFFRYFLDISTKTTTKITFYCIHYFITPPPENFVHSIFYLLLTKPHQNKHRHGFGARFAVS